MNWPFLPKRLESALKALGFLSQAKGPVLSPVIAEHIDVSKDETAKVLQLLAWGGFVISRRGSKGGFHLARPASKIVVGDVIDFFLTHHSTETAGNSPVMRNFRRFMDPCEQAFGSLTLADAANPNTRVPGDTRKQPTPAKATKGQSRLRAEKQRR